MKIQYVDKQGVEAILKLLKNKISSIVDAVVFRGTVNSVADLPSLSDADVKPGDMYTVLTESQTTADFVEGAGETIDPYTEVVVVNQGTVLNPEYKWYVLGNVFTTKDKISYGQSLPNMPYDGMLFFYMGPDVTTPGNELYSNSFYAYNESENTWDYLWTLGDKIWRGTQAEWDALSADEKDKYEQAEIIGLDNNGVVYVVDKIEAGNMNPVTSNAVAKMCKRVSIGSTPDMVISTTGTVVTQITLPKGKWMVFGQLHTNGFSTANQLLTLSISVNGSAAAGEVVDQKVQVPGYWVFVHGMLYLEPTTEVTVKLVAVATEQIAGVVKAEMVAIPTA